MEASSVSHRERSSTSRIPRTAMSEAVEKRVFFIYISQPTTLCFFSTDTKGHYISQLVCILETSTMWQIKAQEMCFYMLH